MIIVPATKNMKREKEDMLECVWLEWSLIGTGVVMSEV
jgi:hypothetical protein